MQMLITRWQKQWVYVILLGKSLRANRKKNGIFVGVFYSSTTRGITTDELDSYFSSYTISKGTYLIPSIGWKFNDLKVKEGSKKGFFVIANGGFLASVSL
jgi:hypothetical protein